MRGKWRLFRQEAGRVSGPPPVVYVLLFVLCIALGQWSVARYGSVYIWPANGVLLAAVLQLHRRQALAVLGSCFAINLAGNLFRGAQTDLVILNAALNLGEAVLAGVLARRFCGAALDMRRPARLARFALLAVAPSVIASALIGVPAAHTAPSEFLSTFQNWFSIETLGLLTVTPALLLLARHHRFEARSDAGAWEKAALIGLLVLVTAGVFAQSAAPVLFLIFLPLLLIAFRLSPRWSALSVLLVAVIGGGFTLNEYGPLMLSSLGPDHAPSGASLPILRALPVFHLFMMAVVCVALPASTVVTERQRLQSRLKARTEAAIKARIAAEQAAAAKSRFLSVMSHELRTPLNGVAGFAELLAQRPCLDTEASHQVDQIRRSGSALLTLVEDILAFSRDNGDLAIAPLTPADLIEEAAARVRAEAEAKGLSVTTVSELPAHARWAGDAHRVRQVLRHLLTNAVKFTWVGEVEARVSLRGEDIEFTVADSGPGIPPAELEGLFEQFSQGDVSISRVHDGVGIGLAISKRLVDAMGGEITAINRPSGGARFTFVLPMARAQDGEAPAAPAQVTDEAIADAPLMGGANLNRAPRVLVVDDHSVNREVAALMLTAAGCEVEMACDGAEAVEAASRGVCDLILMDVRMPHMDGLEATRRIRGLPGRASGVPIVAFTADAMPEDVVRCLEAGMQAHIAKPVSQAMLYAVLNEQLGGQDGPVEADRSVA
jgi:signal transduction histidine kinase/ActR/RegA family two-component response regulator